MIWPDFDPLTFVAGVFVGISLVLLYLSLAEVARYLK
jgi:hypothetical protein